MNQENILTDPEQLNRAFDRDGYVSLAGFFAADEVAEIRENMGKHDPFSEGCWSRKASSLPWPRSAWTRICPPSLTIHWADGNTTSGDKSRQTLGAVYFANRCEVDKRAKAAYQARLDAELAAAGEI